VTRGELLPRSDAEGGTTVRLELLQPAEGGAPSAAQLVEGFPGCTVALEDMFDVAHEFKTVRRRRRRVCARCKRGR
jgi:hypothetical protein